MQPGRLGTLPLSRFCPSRELSFPTRNGNGYMAISDLEDYVQSLAKLGEDLTQAVKIGLPSAEWPYGKSHGDHDQLG